jgi:hypothetical protein
LARSLETDFIEQFLEGRTLRLQSAIQCSAMHQQQFGDLIGGRTLGEQQDSQAAAQPKGKRRGHP